MLKTILSISGKPGLYKLISQGKNMLIVETIDATKKRFPAYGNEKIISLADIAMYTNDSEVPLRDVLRSIKEKENALYDVEFDCNMMNMLSSEDGYWMISPEHKLFCVYDRSDRLLYVRNASSFTGYKWSE